MPKPKHPNDWYDWGSFANGAARAFWASPYISEVENLNADADAERYRHPKRAEALKAAYRALYPGAGGRWEDVIPSTPRVADKVGTNYARKVRDTIDPEDLHHLDDRIPDPDEAGWYAAMQAQGEGVGWRDYGVRFDPPSWPRDDVQIQNAVWDAIRRGIKDAQITIPRPRK